MRQRYMVDKSKVFEDELLQQIIGVAEDEEQTLFLKTLYYTGARISELLGYPIDPEEEQDPLLPERVFWEQNLVKMRNLKSKRFSLQCQQGHPISTCRCENRTLVKVPRRKRWKEVSVPDEFLEELYAFMAKNRIQPKDPFFSFSTRTGQRIVKTCLKKLNLNLGSRKLTPHSFRHGFVMKGVRNKVDLKWLQEQTGHSNIAVLSEYMHIADEDNKRELNKMWAKKGDKDESETK